MKKLLILVFVLTASIFAPVFADTMNYTIRQEGSEMVIVPNKPIIQKTIYKCLSTLVKSCLEERIKSVLFEISYLPFLKNKKGCKYYE